MIHYFKRKNLILVPCAWLNSVAAWCLGVFSPKGTIEVTNTATPKGGQGSIGLDVNVEKVAKLVQNIIDASRELTASERFLIKSVIAGSVDQKYITYKNSLLGLDLERLKAALKEDDDKKEDVPHPLQLRLAKNDNGQPTSLDIYITGNQDVVLGGTAYSINGFTTAGWLQLGRTSGEVWLNESATDGVLEVGSTQLQDEDKISIFIGSCGTDGVVFQNVVGAIYSTGGGGSHKPAMFEMRGVLTSGANPSYSYTAIYLGLAQFDNGTRTYNFRTSGTGGVTSLGGGWYRIIGITTGDVHVIENGSSTTNLVTTHYAKFATSGVRTKNTLSFYVGNVAFSNGVVTVTQDTSPYSGVPCLSFPLEHVEGANENLYENEGGHDSPPSADEYDTQTWERDVTPTITWNGEDFVTTSNEPNGISFQAVTRIRRHDTAGDVLYMRRIYFDKNGMLYKIDQETACYKHRQQTFN